MKWYTFWIRGHKVASVYTTAATARFVLQSLANEHAGGDAEQIGMTIRRKVNKPVAQKAAAVLDSRLRGVN